MKKDISNKIIRKKIIWSEIKAKEQEYNRLQKQISELKKAQSDVSFEVQKKLNEFEDLSKHLDKQINI